MEKIVSYQTSDGSLFKNIENASKHQKNLDLMNYFDNLLEREGYNGMRTEDIYEMLKRNIDEIRETIDEKRK